MVVEGIVVLFRGVEVRGSGGDELRTCAYEEIFKEGQSLRSTSLQSDELVAILLPQRRVDRVVQLGRIERHAYGDEGVHLIILLRDGVVLHILLEVLSARDVD